MEGVIVTKRPPLMVVSCPLSQSNEPGVWRDTVPVYSESDSGDHVRKGPCTDQYEIVSHFVLTYNDKQLYQVLSTPTPTYDFVPRVRRRVFSLAGCIEAPCGTGQTG